MCWVEGVPQMVQRLPGGVGFILFFFLDGDIAAAEWTMLPVVRVGINVHGYLANSTAWLPSVFFSQPFPPAHLALRSRFGLGEDFGDGFAVSGGAIWAVMKRQVVVLGVAIRHLTH